MSYRVRISRAAKKQLDRIPWKEYLVVYQRALSLDDDPRPAASIQLTASKSRRLRVGAYRIIYSVDDRLKEVLVVRVARRNERTYKGL